MKKNLILKILKCTEMHYKSWFEAFFCEVFLTIAVAQLHFLKFSQWLRCLLAGWAEYQNQYISKMEQFYYLFSKPFLPFPSLVTISAIQQILRSIWRIRKQWTTKIIGFWIGHISSPFRSTISIHVVKDFYYTPPTIRSGISWA